MSLPPETARQIDRLTAETQSAGQVPILLAGIVRQGRLAHVSVAGTSDSPAGTSDSPAAVSDSPAGASGTTDGLPNTALDAPADQDTQFRIGSITKTLTAVLVLRMRDQGRLGLDDPLGRNLPDLPVGGLTVRQLLSHGSGLCREPAGAWWERAPGTDVATLLARLTPEAAVRSPYREHHYSNLGYGLLGALLTRLTDASWWELVRAELLAPLGMTRTTYLPQEPFARGYVVHPWHGTLREEPRTDTGAMAPAGQLWSTATDLARWAAFLADPDPAVLARETLAEMCVPLMISDPESWTAGHGLGLELYRHGERIYVGHGGSMPGYVATLAMHRPTGTGVLAFANAYGLRNGYLPAFGRQLLGMVLAADPAPVRPWRPAAAPPPPEIAELTGRWWWMGREWEVSWDGPAAELVVAPVPAGGTPWRFTAEGPDRWRGRSGMNTGELLTVRRDPTGAVDTLDIATFVFTRDPDRVD